MAYNIATKEQILAEKERYKDWLIATGKGNPDNYPSLWMRVDSIFDKLGYSDSILSLIVGRVIYNKKEDAAGLALIVRDQILSYHKEKAPETKSWNDVATALRRYALDFLLDGKIVDETALKNRPDARRLAENVAILYDATKLRSVLKSRMFTQTRPTKSEEGVFFAIREINNLLADNKEFKALKDELVDEIIFYVYNPFEDPDHKNLIKLRLPEIAKIHFGTNGHVSVLTTSGNVYTLLTPTYPGNLLRPAYANDREDLHVDHEPSIAQELKNLKSQLPNIDRISVCVKCDSAPEASDINQEELVKELRLLHKGIELRVMEAAENLAKSDN